MTKRRDVLVKPPRPRIVNCPTPTKQVHESKDAAIRHRDHMRKARAANSDLVAYICQCGAWHIGHSSVRFKKRIRRALNHSRKSMR